MSDDAKARAGLWARAGNRQAARAEIARVAMALFVQQGFEATTVNQIAGGVGISTRSVFRYFPTKEDVALGDVDALLERIAGHLESQPGTVPGWSAMHAALTWFLHERGEDAAFLERWRICGSTPSLRARLAEKRQLWVDRLAVEIAPRMSAGDAAGGVDVFAARAVVAAALACLDEATRCWASDPAVPLAEVFAAAMAAVPAAAGSAQPTAAGD